VIAQDRLAELEDGRFYYEFKRVWKNGTRGIFFEGPDPLERLAALIPPPRRHRYETRMTGGVRGALFSIMGRAVYSIVLSCFFIFFSRIGSGTLIDKL